MNSIYQYLNSIDVILSGLSQVYTVKGPEIWFYNQKVKSSLEDELLSDCQSRTGLYHTLPPGGVFYPDLGLWKWYLDGSLRTEKPLPITLNRKVLHNRSVDSDFVCDWRMNQILHGIRAMILVLIDSSGACAKDSDYVGNLSYQGARSALLKMMDLEILEFVSFSKYWKDWPTARFLRNPLPVVPACWTRLGFSPTSSVFDGELGSYFRRLATHSDHSDDPKRFFLATTAIAQSKRAFAVVPKEFTKQTLQKHANILSSPPDDKLQPPDLVEFRSFCRVFFSRAKPSKVPYAQRVRNTEPSHNACLENPRHEGGSYRYIQELRVSEEPVSLPLEKTRVDIQAFSPDARPEFPEHVPFLRMSEVSPGNVTDVKGNDPKTASEIELLAINSDLVEEISSQVYVEQHSSSQNEDKVIKQLIAAGMGELPLCRAVPILEPLKVRVITAMPAVSGYLSTPLQQDMFEYFRTFDVFSLIGEPFNPGHIYSLHKKYQMLVGQNIFNLKKAEFVSGDYSSATDLIRGDLTKVAIEEAVRAMLTFEDRHIFEDTLLSNIGNHVITYSDLPPVRMVNGQLMGSNLSFPILCLINFYSYLKSLQDPWFLTNFNFFLIAPVLINGDDIGFFSTPSQTKRWSEFSPRLGLYPSQGKNFVHPRFGMLNSQPFEILTGTLEHHLRMVRTMTSASWADADDSLLSRPYYDISVNFLEYCNMGLLTGQSKLTGKDSKRSMPLEDWYAMSVGFSMNPLFTHARFLYYHKETIEKATRVVGHNLTLNLFAHRQLGGLGFRPPKSIEPRFDDFQRRLAYLLSQNSSVVFDYFENGKSPEVLPSVYFLQSIPDPIVEPYMKVNQFLPLSIPYRSSTIFPVLGNGPLNEDLSNLELFNPVSGSLPKNNQYWIPSIAPEMKPSSRLFSRTITLLSRRLGDEGVHLVPRYPFELMTLPIISSFLSSPLQPGFSWTPSKDSLVLKVDPPPEPVEFSDDSWESSSPSVNITSNEDEKAIDPYEHLRNSIPVPRKHFGKLRRSEQIGLANQSMGYIPITSHVIKE